MIFAITKIIQASILVLDLIAIPAIPTQVLDPAITPVTLTQG